MGQGDQGWDFALDEEGVYYSLLVPPSTIDGEIHRAAVDGSEHTTLVATTLSGAVRLALDGDDLLWAEASWYSVELHSMPLGGGPVLALGPQSAPYVNVYGSVVDPEYVYWFVDDLILRSDRSPGATRPLATAVAFNEAFNTLAEDATHLYYMEGPHPQGPRTISRVRKDGSEAPSVFVERALPFDFAIESDYLYFSEPGQRDAFGNHDRNGRIMRKPLDGSELETVAMAAGEPFAIAVDVSGVYWLEVDSGNRKTELWHARADGIAAPVRLLSSDMHSRNRMKLNATSIYWMAYCDDDATLFILGMAKP